MTEKPAIPVWRRILRGIGRALVTVAVLIYTVLDELLFPLFRPLIRRLGELRLFQRIGAWIGKSHSYLALVLLAVPFVIIEPAKLFAVYWGAIGHVVQGPILLIAFHALSLLVVERIFHAGYEPLMRIGWFKALLDWLFGLRDRAIAWAKATPAWQAAAGWVRGAREWLRGLLASLR